MKALINRLEKIPVSVSELQKVVPSHTRVISYDQLKTTLDANFEAGKPNVILLIEGKDRIGHFVLLTKKQKGLRLWNSYGFLFLQSVHGQSATRIAPDTNSCRILIYAYGKFVRKGFPHNNS